jgi:hypothetical protein
VKVRTGLIVAVVLGVVVGAFVVGNHAPRVLSQAEPRSMGGPPHYNVVETEGHNLIVTDNRTDKLYFYTIDKDKEIGTELRLRATIDLSQVGKEVITPKHPGGGK